MPDRAAPAPLRLDGIDMRATRLMRIHIRMQLAALGKLQEKPKVAPSWCLISLQSVMVARSRARVMPGLLRAVFRAVSVGSQTVFLASRQLPPPFMLPEGCGGRKLTDWLFLRSLVARGEGCAPTASVFCATLLSWEPCESNRCQPIMRACSVPARKGTFMALVSFGVIWVDAA